MLAVAVKLNQTATIGKDAVTLLGCDVESRAVTVSVNGTTHVFSDPQTVAVEGGLLYVIRVSRVRASLGYSGTALVLYPRKKRNIKTCPGGVYRATPPKRGTHQE